MKKRFRWRAWIIENGTFAILLIMGYSYDSLLAKIMVCTYIAMNIVVFLTIYVSLKHTDEHPIFQHVIDVAYRNRTNCPDMLDTIYDVLIICYLSAEKAYILAGIYFIVMFIQQALTLKVKEKKESMLK